MPHSAGRAGFYSAHVPYLNVDNSRRMPQDDDPDVSSRRRGGVYGTVDRCGQVIEHAACSIVFCVIFLEAVNAASSRGSACGNDFKVARFGGHFFR